MKQKLTIYQVDAFTDKIFHGNPAAVCPLEKWLPDETMQNIARENNLSETAFFVRKNNRFEIRWFTPAVEVDLCGHATLATGHVLYEHLGYKEDVIFLSSRSGELRVARRDGRLVLDFPAGFYEAVPVPHILKEATGINPVECGKAMDFLMAVYDDEAVIRNMKPDFALLKQLPYHAVIVTAKGKEVDFVSRMFAPAIGIDEDPVTGSAHSVLTPYWSHHLGKVHLKAKQISARGGSLFCKMSGDRVEIGGDAVTYLMGEIWF
ncbi:MAG: PhzF family phenazine biosynthesis protein [Bacteroidales bacterium]